MLFQLYEVASNQGFNDSIPVVDGSMAYAGTAGSCTGKGKGQFSCPRGLSLDDIATELYVSDHLNHRIQVFVFSSAAAIAPNRDHKSNGLSTLLPKRAQPLVFSRFFGAKGSGRGQLNHPSGLDVSHYHVIVCDTGNSRLVAFTKHGIFVRTYGTKGTHAGEFLDIRDLKLVNIRKVRTLIVLHTVCILLM